MLTSFPVSIVVGTILGFLTGLGTGGGSLLILWLTLICRMAPEQARSINLMFFIPSAVCATILRGLQKQLPWKKILLPTLTGCICAGFFAWFSAYIDKLIFEKIFGLLLIYLGLRELFYKKK